MSPPYDSELLPLLAVRRSTEPPRLHFLDNLRTALTAILIFYHASTLVVWENIFILIFTFINNASIAFWGLFFFVSGYSATLALAASSDANFFLSRTTKVGIPAAVYASIVHPRLSTFLSLGWREIFGSIRTPGTYAKLSGPVAYVVILLSFDYLFLLGRLTRRKSSHVDRALTWIWPATRQQFLVTAALSMTTLASFIFDVLDSDAPLSFLIAYTAGVNFDAMIDFLDMSLRRACVFLLISLVLPCLSIGIYSIFFAISIPVISIFTQAKWTTREWGFMTRHTEELVGSFMASSSSWRIRSGG